MPIHSAVASGPSKHQIVLRCAAVQAAPHLCATNRATARRPSLPACGNVLLVTIPPLIVYVFFKRQIVVGMTAGAVKG